MRIPSPIALRRRAASRLAAREGGFTLIEVVLAATIFLIVAASLTSVLVSGLVSHTTSRERTRAEQIAQAQIERARKIPWDNIGTVAGNPPGTIPAAGWSGTVPSGYTVLIDVEKVQDAVPTANQTVSTIKGDYKKISVSVTRTKDGKQLALLSTLASPPSRLGGINGAALRVSVKDWALPPSDSSSSIDGATVALANGPSSDRSDTTNALGQVEFLDLLPTNASAPGNYYDVSVAKTGYVTFDADVSPASAAHVQLAPTQVGTTTIRLFKPATIVVSLKNGGAPYALPATVKILSASTGNWTTHALNAPDGLLTLTSLAGDHVFPNVVYTAYAYTPTGLCASSVQKTVPDSYPTDLDTQFDLDLGACPSAGLDVSVSQLGLPADGATVTLTGGPNDVSVAATANASGIASFANVPLGPQAYTISASRTVQGTTYTASTTAAVTADPSSASIALPSPTTATVNVTVNAGGSPLQGAQVTLANSPFGDTIAPQTTNASGIATFTGVAVGTGYTLDATHSASGLSRSVTGVTVSAPTTNQTLTMPQGSVTVNATQSAVAAGSAAVTLTGGPLSISRSGTANASGSYTFANVPAGSGYTVTASKLSQTGTVTPVGVTDATTTTVAVTIPAPPTGTVNVTTTWAGLAVAGASVRLQNTGLAYDQTVTADASGIASFANVPTGTGYTITSTASGQSATQTSYTVATGSNAASLALPVVTFNIRVRRGTTNQVGAIVKLSLGPMSIAEVQATTNGSGIASFTNVPQGAGYTIKAYPGSCTAVSSPKSVTATNQTAGTSTLTVTYSGSTCPL